VFYRDQTSTPSITEATLAEDSNLDIYYTLGVNEFEINNSILYPNPSKGIKSIGINCNGN